MHMQKRYLHDQVQEDLERKMVFVAGPRQVGKTTFGLSLPGAESGRPLVAVECKWGDGNVDKSLRYWKGKFAECPCWQVSATGTKDYVTPGGIRVCPATALLASLV
jgi:hypothetical protein